MITEYIGIDLAKSWDFTAFCIMEEDKRWWSNKLGRLVSLNSDDLDFDEDKTEKKLGVIDLFRVNRQEMRSRSWGYVCDILTEQIEKLIARQLKRVEREALKDNLLEGRNPTGSQLFKIAVWIDATGVGNPVVDMIEKSIEPFQEENSLKVYPVMIIGGQEGYKEEPYKMATVSKIHLIDNCYVMMENKEFVFSRGLSKKRPQEWKEFLEQKENFRRKRGIRAGTVRYEAIEGEHDDLIIALAFACLGAKQPEPEPMTDFYFFNL